MSSILNASIFFYLSISILFFTRKVYDETQNELQVVWSFQRHQLIEVVLRRSPLPKPFSILFDMHFFFASVFGPKSLTDDIRMICMYDISI